MNQVIATVNQQNPHIPLFCCLERRQRAEIAIMDRTATFDDLVAIEPYLQCLMNEAIQYKKQSKRKRHVCANSYWYGSHGPGLKDRLVKLVGWDARKRILKSEYVYDLAYFEIYDALPACKNCLCL